MTNQFPLRFKSSLIASLLIAGISSTAQAGPVLLQDAYTTTGTYAALNYGNNPSLNVAAGKPSFVQFAVNSYLPAGVVGNDIAKATLKVFVNSVKASGTFNVYAVSSAWTEAGINATNQPAVGAQLVGPIAISNASSQQWISIDITNQVKDWLDGVSNNNGLALVSADGVSVFFDSKENTTSSHAPEIEISLAGIPGPKGVTGATGLTGSTGPQGSAGLNGANGATGPQGLQGSVGLTGATGATGPQGIQGLQGATGNTGATGNSYIPGHKYALGNIGPNNGKVFYVDGSGEHGLEAQVNDLATLNYYDAIILCQSIYGAGWHLPTKTELQLLFEQKNFVGNFTAPNYWSSTETDAGGAWYQTFANSLQNNITKAQPIAVRAVKIF